MLRKIYMLLFVYEACLDNFMESYALACFFNHWTLILVWNSTMTCWYIYIFCVENFLVCTSHFVVMFNGGDSLGRNKRSCNAYISRSTRGLRSMLREHVRCTPLLFNLFVQSLHLFFTIQIFSLFLFCYFDRYKCVLFYLYTVSLWLKNSFAFDRTF